jgi:hypothetical protein
MLKCACRSQNGKYIKIKRFDFSQTRCQYIQMDPKYLLVLLLLFHESLRNEKCRYPNIYYYLVR